MSPVSILFLVFAVALIIGVPFIWAMMLSCLCAAFAMGTVPLTFFAQRMFTGGEKYVFLAIFFFLLAGAIMQHGGISKRLVAFAKAWFGHMTGGLSIVVLIACMFFAALCGSNVATVVAIGSMLYPELIKAGYPKGYAAALPTVGGTLGIVIPPSIVFVVYGSTVNTSISKLLISGIGPGVLGGVAMCLYAYYYAKRHNLPKADRFDLGTALAATRDAFWALLMPLIILGGIYSGIFTPTESAAVAVLYGLIVAFFYKSLSFGHLARIMVTAVEGTANILLLIMAATVFGWVLTANGFPTAFNQALSQFIHDKTTFLLCLNVMLLVLGMLMDTGPIILIIAPLIYPVAMKFGIDPVHLGCIVVFNLSVGQATPPFGLCLFASSGVTGQSIMALSKNSLPFIIVLYGCVLLTSFIPAISTGLLVFMN
ncbi:MAG: TRAP transporter large permease [Methylobacteriaceae bacterium]|jgi:C4-dicarboxylate transporter DctM subunit|nr:TRAP transporter large permease [Methylobacteriaceae bacterium]